MTSQRRGSALKADVPRTRTVTRVQVFAYLDKAEEFLAAAKSELEAGRTIAATSLAIHPRINAADALCGARLGRRAAGQDHDGVVKLLGQAGADGAELQKELRRLLPLKTKAEYSPDDVALPEATRGVARASRSVAIARRVIAKLR